jgi:hypothetical protein
MKFLEKDLEAIIFETDKEFLNGRGLKCAFGDSIYKRQVRVGNYGIIDILQIDRIQYGYYPGSYLIFTVYELKKNQISVNTFLQALRYCKGISRYLESRGFSKDYVFRINLIGDSIDIGDFIYLTDMILTTEPPCSESIDSVDYYTYEYLADGIYFKRHSEYSLKDEGFNTGFNIADNPFELL